MLRMALCMASQTPQLQILGQFLIAASVELVVDVRFPILAVYLLAADFTLPLCSEPDSLTNKRCHMPTHGDALLMTKRVRKPLFASTTAKRIGVAASVAHALVNWP
jgi:hypothetical protein